MVYFGREIKALEPRPSQPGAALDHGREGGVHYLVTEYVPGIDLRKLVRRNGPLGMARRQYRVASGVGLEYAHNQGLSIAT